MSKAAALIIAAQQDRNGDLPSYLRHFTPPERARYEALDSRAQKWVRFQAVKKGVKPLVALAWAEVAENKEKAKKYRRGLTPPHQGAY